MDLGVHQKKMIVVAVKASKEIPKATMEWALTHIVEPENCVMLLVVTTPQSFGFPGGHPSHFGCSIGMLLVHLDNVEHCLPAGKKVWGLQRFTTDCTTGIWRSHTGTFFDFEEDITDSCSQLMHQLCEDHKSCKINVKIKVLSGSIVGVVAAEAKREQTDWVILDKKLKSEAKHCMEHLQCNVVMMKGSHPKVLRLNLIGSHDVVPELMRSLSSTTEAPLDDETYGLLDSIRVPNVTPSSSPEHETSYTATNARTSSVSSSDAGTSSFSVSGTIEELTKEFMSLAPDGDKLKDSDSDTDNESMSSANFYQPCTRDRKNAGSFIDRSLKSTDLILTCASRNLKRRFSIPGILSHRLNLNSVSIRDAISLPKHSAADPPPLCSKCQHKTPIFGKPPHSFTYTELETATDGFSQHNFLAEGGFGSVYRGVLQDGQVVAVKQYKLASTQGDSEFCSEVEVLSCAQHRNVVMLIGFCVEGGRRLLVYEYVCNRSLDHHLYGRSSNPLEWPARQKIAVGSARGLRYLHEECRVGCVVHRDMRPNNILVTHDFEPLVGDFGLARCQPDGGVREETRVIGTFGYLAPEYAQSGQITEKADVYSFGIVLLELITGRKAVDINRTKGEQCLTEWARRLLRDEDIRKLIDPHLGDSYVEQEICSMLHCASLCIRKNPDLRPRMSQVLQILEGGF